MQDLKQNIANTGKKLILREAFYGLLLLTINKLKEEKIPTAGVSLQGINTCLSVNPDFWFNTLKSQDERIAILKHELLHLAMFHLHNRARYADKILFNIAADCEINQYIDKNMLPGANIPRAKYDQMLEAAKQVAESLKPQLESGAITEEEFIKQIPDVPIRPVLLEDYDFGANDAKKGTKYYYDRLKQQLGTGQSPHLDQMYQAMQAGVPTVCSHGTWKDFENLPKATQELIKGQVDYQLKTTAQSMQKSRGTIPGELRDYIDDLLKDKPAVIDWRGYFRLFIGSSNKTYVRKTRRRPSYRHPDSPKIIIKSEKHVLFAVDTSGSMSNRELQECFQELQHVMKSGVQVTVVECDAAIGRVYPYDRAGAQGTKISGGGGTSFQPVVDMYNEGKDIYTTLVYFTDGYAPVPNPSPLKQMLWVLSSGNTYGSMEVDAMKSQGFPGAIVKIVKDWED